MNFFSHLRGRSKEPCLGRVAGIGAKVAGSPAGRLSGARHSRARPAITRGNAVVPGHGHLPARPCVPLAVATAHFNFRSAALGRYQGMDPILAKLMADFHLVLADLARALLHLGPQDGEESES